MTGPGRVGSRVTHRLQNVGRVRVCVGRVGSGPEKVTRVHLCTFLLDLQQFHLSQFASEPRSLTFYGCLSKYCVFWRPRLHMHALRLMHSGSLSSTLWLLIAWRFAIFLCIAVKLSSRDFVTIPSTPPPGPMCRDVTENVFVNPNLPRRKPRLQDHQVNVNQRRRRQTVDQRRRHQKKNRSNASL